MTASYEIVLTAIDKLTQNLGKAVTTKEKIAAAIESRKITEYLCPALSELGSSYLNKHSEELTKKLCTKLSSNCTTWSKCSKNFKISGKELDKIVEEIPKLCNENNESDNCSISNYSSISDATSLSESLKSKTSISSIISTKIKDFFKGGVQFVSHLFDYINSSDSYSVNSDEQDSLMLGEESFLIEFD